jgi:hypothetical protein
MLGHPHISENRKERTPPPLAGPLREVVGGGFSPSGAHDSCLEPGDRANTAHWVMRRSMAGISGSAEAAADLDSLHALPRADPSPYPLPQGEGEFIFCGTALALRGSGRRVANAAVFLASRGRPSSPGLWGGAETIGSAWLRRRFRFALPVRSLFEALPSHRRDCAAGHALGPLYRALDDLERRATALRAGELHCHLLERQISRPTPRITSSGAPPESTGG